MADTALQRLSAGRGPHVERPENVRLGLLEGCPRADGASHRWTAHELMVIGRALTREKFSAVEGLSCPVLGAMLTLSNAEEGEDERH
ncbi:hypothetical protein CC78DRAFT_529816 [Lojkania enalia]|uniref:Uncharacterized protein n=1 Tax=Lojkania enalia TaxID=147567 RepID=A0A9P4N7B9_9PLEO|nr:hypothetical protein CC78DRAFT_529816 [Didymosphaeria enalia]